MMVGMTTTVTATHDPVSILSPDGTGVRSVIACSCGEQPRKGAARGSTMHVWYMSHRRKLGLPRISSVAGATYAFGHGYPAEGMTWEEWRDHTDEDPFGVRP